MTATKPFVWALIPARGGSKSIPLKNMAQLAGRPLIDYVIEAGKKSKTVTRIICSTDHPTIVAHCREHGIEVHDRPNHLCQDMTPVSEVLVDLLKDIQVRERKTPDIVVLLEPTYPFVLAKHIDECVTLLIGNREASSVQSVSEVAHGNHAYNQRVIKDGCVDFVFKEQRQRCYNKQLKPQFYVHGNLFVFRTQTLFDTGNIYGTYSLPYVVPLLNAFDVDVAEDLAVAEALLCCGLIEGCAINGQPVKQYQKK